MGGAGQTLQHCSTLLLPPAVRNSMHACCWALSCYLLLATFPGAHARTDKRTH